MAAVAALQLVPAFVHGQLIIKRRNAWGGRGECGPRSPSFVPLTGLRRIRYRSGSLKAEGMPGMGEEESRLVVKCSLPCSSPSTSGKAEEGSAVSTDFNFEALSASLKVDALREGFAGGRMESAESVRLLPVALAGSFLGQILCSGRAFGEAVANETGATVMEATGQAGAIADSGPVPSWLQPAILAAPLLLYGGFYWYRENVNQRLSPFDYVTLLLVVLAVSNLVLAFFFKIRLF